MNMFPLLCNTQKDQRYWAGGDDPGLEISSFAQGGGKVRCPSINIKVALASELSFLDMASEHRDWKIEHESHVDCDWKDPAYLDAMSKAVTIGDDMVDRIV